MGTIDLNADLGEGLPAEVDDALLAIVTSASVACGGHAGDRKSMTRILVAARPPGIRIGAHPSYPDRQNFGRASVPMQSHDLVATILDQTRALERIAREHGVNVEYLKPHGALYNDAASKPEIHEAVKRAAVELGLPLMILAGSPLSYAPHRTIREGFIDRGYQSDGSLIPRSQPGAILTDPRAAAEQAVRLAPEVDSLCVHSDTPGCVSLLSAARTALVAAGHRISAQ